MSKHIRSINIDSFRGIQNLELNDLGEVNILLGDNNCGKTTVLETIKILNGIDDLLNWSSVLRRKSSLDLMYYDAFKLLFNNNTKKNLNYSVNIAGKEIKINVKAETESFELTQNEINSINLKRVSVENDHYDEDEIEETKSVEKLIFSIDCKSSVGDDFVTVQEIWNFQRGLKNSNKIGHKAINVVSINPTQHSDNRFYLSNILDNPELYIEILNILKSFDSKIISINADRSSNEFAMFPVYKILSENFSEAMPLSVYGDGMKKAILLMSAVVKAKNGVLLIDEFETALHTSAMKEIFSWIINTCKKLNVQLFLTTHSEEAVNHLLSCPQNQLENMKVITLKKKSDKSLARVLNGDKAKLLKTEMGLELR